MAKANKKTKKQKELQQLNVRFDEIMRTLNDIALSVEAFMPLVADSLRFTNKVIQMYKQSFNMGLKNE